MKGGTATREFRRRLGRYTTGRPGPRVVVCGGLHGNEPAGVLAARCVLHRLEGARLPLRGELIVIAGNLAALAARRRYLEADLNRIWLPEKMAALRRRDPARDHAEESEQRALLELFDELGASGHLVVLDLHTTSGQSPPFTIMSDTLRNRRLAFALPTSVVLGLEESVDGTLLEFLTEQGHTAVMVEAGRHDDPGCVDLHEAVIWLGLAAAGALKPGEIPDHAAHRERLHEASRGMPRVTELRYRHPVVPGDGFRMRPGYRGLQPVRESEVLAHDHRGEIRAPGRGRILMPLYQKQGDAGFYLVRRVSRVWLLVSGALRWLRLGKLLPLLPGVTQHPEEPHALRVDAKVARWLVVEVFQLFGFRRRRTEGDDLVFSRRRPG
ncbi:MAG: succinylglutamate desuccinylase/aspartoacylase family protein [Planctomycetota bacterium]